MSQALAFYQRNAFYFFAISISAILSFWAAYHETVINSDGICYLLSAQIIEQSGIKGAMQLCGQAKWPFYSTLIYAFVQLTHFSYTSAAFVLNGFFSSLSVLLFILIVKELGGSRRVLLFAALTILLANEFNSVREYIVRDHGFWAFYLASFLFLLHFFRKPKWIFAFGFSVSLLIATLFRIEGAVSLLILPLVSFFFANYSLSARLKFFFMLNSLLFVALALVLSWLALHPQQSLDQLGRLSEVPHHLQKGWLMISERFIHATAGLKQYVLPIDSAKDSSLILLITLGIWYLIKVISNFSIGYTILAIMSWLHKSVFKSGTLIVVAYLVVNILITLGFFLENFFLTKRYLLALSLILMLWVPFAFDYLLQNWHDFRSRLILLVASFFILFSTIGGIFNFGYSKDFVRTSGDWLAKNVPTDATLYVNDHVLMYYSKHFGYDVFNKTKQYDNLDALKNGNWKNFDYLAFRIGKNKKKLSVLDEINLKPIQIFNNKRGDRVIIYRVNRSM